MSAQVPSSSELGACLNRKLAPQLGPSQEAPHLYKLAMGIALYRLAQMASAIVLRIQLRKPL